MFRLTCVALAALGTMIGPAAAGEMTIPELVEHARPAIARIQATSPGSDSTSQGTAFFVTTTAVITSRHVVAGTQSAVLTLADGTTREVRGVLADDEANDLAMLLCDEVVAVKPLRIAPKSPRPGESILVVGSPLGLDASASDGIVSGLRSHTSGAELLQFTAPISPGSSGSPVLSMDGLVVGVVRSKIQEGEALNLASSVQAIRGLKIGAPRPLRGLKLSRSSTEGSVAKLLALAKELREAGRPEVACVALRDGLKEWSESPELWADLGFALRECGDLPGAVEALQAATSLDPTNVTALEALAALCARLHRLYEVFDARLALLKLSPDSTAAFAAVALTVPSGRTFGPWIDYLGERARDSQAPWFVFRYLTRALVRDEGFEDAVLPAQRWVQLQPDDPEGWENLALAAAQTKRRAAALDALERAKELQSEDVTESMPHATPAQRQAARAEVRAARHKVYAEVYSLLGMNSEAVQELKAAILAKPRDYAQHVDLGLAHARGGNADSALEEFQLAYDLCAQGEFASQFPDILANTRASILVRWSQGLQLLGKAQPAIETVSRIPSVAPDWAAETHREIAFIHFASGRFVPAIEAFEEAFRLNPELVWPDAHYKFAIALLKTGNREKALREYGVLGAIANRQDLEGTGTPRQARAYLSELAALLYK